MVEDLRSDDDDSELDHILAEYYRRIDAGEAIDKDQFVAEHPDQADALIEFLSGEAQLQADPGGPQGQRALWEGEAEWMTGAFALCLLEDPDLCDGKTPSRL